MVYLWTCFEDLSVQFNDINGSYGCFRVLDLRISTNVNKIRCHLKQQLSFLHLAFGCKFGSLKNQILQREFFFLGHRFLGSFLENKKIAINAYESLGSHISLDICAKKSSNLNGPVSFTSH